MVEWNTAESKRTNEFLMNNYQLFLLGFVVVTWFGTYSYVKRQIMPIPKLQSVFKTKFQQILATVLISLVLSVLITRLALYSTTFFN